jgi:diguanylate cyclase (GGDEF)-like protein
MQPLYKFIRKKRREHGLVKRHIDRQEKITKKDILRDVHSFTDSTETQRYMSALMRQRKYLDDDAWRILPKIGNLSAAAAEKKTAKLEKRAGLANIDGLTGLKNLRAYESDSKLWIERENVETTLIVIDIDFFKKFNDTYGHKTGDRVLKFVADTMKKIGGEDFTYRYGGEEFVVMLPKIKFVAGKAIAEHIRREIEEKSKPLMAAINKEIVIEPEKRRESITISAGVAGYPQNAKNQIELFNKADVALYVAKSSGRNQVHTT